MNRKLEYALIALKYMSGKAPGQLSSANEVVAATGVPFDATARVMQQLAQRGWLRSEQGAHGGYSIIRDLARVTLLDLTEIILGPIEVVKCLNREAECELLETCNIQLPIAILNRKLVDFYSSVFIADLLKIKEVGREAQSSH